jgi:hypothetical protein
MALHHRTADRPLPAAVLRENDPGAENVARVVPQRARLVKIGDAVAGYHLTPRRARWQFSFRSRRVAEIDALARLRYHAAPPPPAAARAFAEAVAHHAEPNEAAGWVNRWCIRLSGEERAAIVADAAASPRKWRATELGELLKLRRGERQLLGIRTFRAVGQTKRDLTEANRRRERERKRAARAERPKVVSQEATAPWAAAGVSRATWYRLRAKAANVARHETKNVGSKYNRILPTKSVSRAATSDVAPSAGSTADRILAIMDVDAIDVATVVARTGFDHRVVRPALSRLLAAGKVVRIARGIYRVAAPQAPAVAQSDTPARCPVGSRSDRHGAPEHASGPGRAGTTAPHPIGSSGGPLPVRRAAPRPSRIFPKTKMPISISPFGERTTIGELR